MQRIEIKDGTTWPNPNTDSFKTLAWHLRYAPDLIDTSGHYAAAGILEAYATLILHPAFTLKKVQEKVSGIRKAIELQELREKGKNEH